MARDSRLALARSACGLTQDQLADEAGVARGTVIGAENERRPWRASQQRIAGVIARHRAKLNGGKRVTKGQIDAVRRELWP